MSDNNGYDNISSLPSRSAHKDISGEQLTRFSDASDRLFSGDKGFSCAVYIHFALKLCCVVLAVLMLRVFIAEPTYVNGESMVSTLMHNERVLVEKVSDWFSEPKRGDIVIVRFPNRSERFVKRVIALGGETITIKDGYVYVDNVRLDESEYAGDWYGRITRLIRTEGSVNGSYTVPEGYIFVMGDNRNVSHDSRAEDVGAIPLEHVIGRACAVIWPIGKIRSTN